MDQYVIRPEPHVFDDYTDEKYEDHAVSTVSPSLQKVVASQKTLVYVTEKVDYPDEGILMKYQGVEYPRQGFVFPEAMDNVNNLKRVTVLLLSLVKGNGNGFLKGRIGAFLAHYCRVAEWLFQWYDPNSQKVRKIFLKEHRYRQSVRQLIRFINLFIQELGIKVCEFKGAGEKDFGKVVGTMIEYDNAYHWTLEDLASEINPAELYNHPRKEILRIFEIYKQREKRQPVEKVGSLVSLITCLLYLPSVRKAFRASLKQIDLEKMKMTPNDRYYTMNYGGYEFEGKTIEERQKIWMEMNKGTPPIRIMIPAQ